MDLPGVFCWSKFGTEAGEPATRIVRRKEAERLDNGGVFMWGIGNSIRPSLAILLRRLGDPEVIFTPMLSRAAPTDVAPASILLWRQAIGIDGRPYSIPQYSAVTSKGTTRRRHFALVCRSDRPLDAGPSTECTFAASAVRNLRTGSAVGSSQVTSVVSMSHTPAPASSDRAYSVAFRARLVYPFLVTLRDPVAVPEEMHTSARASVGASGDLRALRDPAHDRSALCLF